VLQISADLICISKRVAPFLLIFIIKNEQTF